MLDAGCWMADGPMADGRWPMAEGRWPMADGRWPMADGRWPMADGRWPMADGRWPMADGRWPMPIEYCRCDKRASVEEPRNHAVYPLSPNPYPLPLPHYSSVLWNRSALSATRTIPNCA
jgi:2-amino-4-hydroxy-6-hydroxymethyldihydropteridine diphosphokinase